MTLQNEAHYGGTLMDVRKHIHSEPWEPGRHGKGAVIRGRVIAWNVEPSHKLPNESDGWPAHVDAIHALLGKDPYASAWYGWRSEMATFYVSPRGGIDIQNDPDRTLIELVERYVTERMEA